MYERQEVSEMIGLAEKPPNFKRTKFTIFLAIRRATCPK